MALAALASLIGGNRGGVWFLPGHADPKSVQSAAKRAGFAFFHVEGRNIARKEQLLNHVANALHFPEHFGHNWDALEECLTDLEWVDAEGYVIYYDHIDPFLCAQPEQFETLVEILRDAVQSWKEDDTAMIVLLSGTKAPKGVRKVGEPAEG
ncbi:MAG TPA: barstar family protein [Usitatibacter sp.]|nr:barstar family protein [Usitatibacter sp.]